jgi:pre-mRNA-processing factor 17
MNFVKVFQCFQVVVSAPVVEPMVSAEDRSILDPTLKEVKFNPKYEDMYAPV